MKLGIIGYGLRIRNVLADMEKADPRCHVAGIVDIRESIPQAEREGHVIPRFDTPEEMIREVQPDGIMIGTRCSLHTKMAMKVLPKGIPLFLEKPVATTMEDLYQLKHCYENHQSEVVVSFPLRMTSIVKLVKEIIDSGKIGTIEHIQAVNNVPYGGVYYHGWYRNENETGGLFLQKATHDFDYLNYIVGLQPVSICAMTSKQIFKGTKPAKLLCVDCEENRTCPESTAFTPNAEIWPFCSFAEDTGNEDSGSALIRYDSGMHMSYSQNFFVRDKAGSRGARFMGFKGTLEFDFITGKIQVFMHHTPRVETYELKVDEGHFGGDIALAENFIGIVRRETTSISNLEDGMLSALMCLKAKQSAQTESFQKIEWD
jgi:predicted dehydrogenase